MVVGLGLELRRDIVCLVHVFLERGGGDDVSDLRGLHVVIRRIHQVMLELLTSFLRGPSPAIFPFEEAAAALAHRALFHIAKFAHRRTRKVWPAAGGASTLQKLGAVLLVFVVAVLCFVLSC